MKPFIYFAAALMIGASIYGFIDHKKTNQHKDFKNLYESKETTAPAKTINPLPETLAANKQTESAPEKTELKKETATKKKANTKKVKAEKKINHKLFSRAPLREFEFPLEEVPSVPKVRKMEETTRKLPENK